MDPNHWRAVEELFAAAAERPAADREAFLIAEAAKHGFAPEAVVEVRSLLAHDQPEAVPLPEVEGALVQAAASWVDDREHQPRRLGPYRLIEVLGEGGMGTVWLAERQDGYQQRVAIKLSRSGALSPAESERFRAERQILARLEHPAIARLLDGGETPEGSPYLVMELVDGRPLLEHAATNQLDLRQKVQLFLPFCDAVEHAHRRLIVHRDLKPSNLLVTAEGRPKLVDFGIAKLLAGEGLPSAEKTALHQRYYTAGYASPEQVRGEAITTASDVYSLAVVLSELLTGDRQTSREVPLDRDLGLILERARAEEPERRYGSVAAFGEDLRRWLEGLPVAARPDTLRYRARKFVHRHRLAVAVAVLAVATLVVFLLALLAQNFRIERERDRARQAEAEAREVAGFLTHLFATADPRRSGGETVTARALLDQGAAALENDRANPPEVRAAMLSTMAIAYRGLGLQSRGIELAEKALALHGPVTAGNELEAAKTIEILGDGLRDAARYREAEPLLRRTLEIRNRRLPPDHLEVAETANDLGLLLLQTGRLAEARPLLERGLAIRRLHAESRPVELAVSLSNLSQLANEEGRLADAEVLNREALEIRRRTLGPTHPQTANSLHGLGRTLDRQGRFAEAEALIREAVKVRREKLGEDHPETAIAEASLASFLQDQGQLDEAETLYRQVLAVHRSRSGERQLETAVALNNLASLLEDRGQYRQAEELLTLSLSIREEVMGPASASTARARQNLGRVVAAAGRTEEGLALMSKAEEARRALLPGASSDLASGLAQKARVLLAAGQETEALAHFEEAVALQDAALGSRHPAAAEVRAERAALAARLAAGVDCQAEIESALATLEAAGPAVRPALARAWIHAGDCLVLAGEKEKARERWRQAQAVLAPRFGPGNRWVQELTRRLE